MYEHVIDEVLEYAEDLKREWRKRDDVHEFNQAVMRLSDAALQLSTVNDFDEVKG